MAIKKRSAVRPNSHEGDTLAIKSAPVAAGASFWKELPQHIMSGISRMVPTLIMGGVILAISQLIAYVWLEIRLTPVFSTRLTQANSPVSISRY